MRTKDTTWLTITTWRCNTKRRPKLIGIFFVSKYMVKKYGFEEAVRRSAKRKKK